MRYARFSLLSALLLLPAAATVARAEDPRAGIPRLEAAIAQYRAIAARGGWPRIPAGRTLREGDASPRVGALRMRLYTTGDLPAGSDFISETFDAPLREAVRRFQSRHGLDTDGAVGRGTLAALNVPVERRIRQLEANLGRFADLPADLGEKTIIVNVPEFILRAYERNETRLTMRVVVGAVVKDRPTPVFSDTMEYVIFNPPWYVPNSIARNELIPDVRGDSGLLGRRNFEVVGDGETIDPAAAPLDEATLARVEAGELTLRQRPGPRNPLGRIKFIFPNNHAVYLHDTSERRLFARAYRAASHGCIRVERPNDLAAYVLPDWTPERITEVIRKGREKHVRLTHLIPVHIRYWTARVDPDGTVYFFEDIYRLDR